MGFSGQPRGYQSADDVEKPIDSSNVSTAEGQDDLRPGALGEERRRTQSQRRER